MLMLAALVLACAGFMVVSQPSRHGDALRFGPDFPRVAGL